MSKSIKILTTALLSFILVAGITGCIPKDEEGSPTNITITAALPDDALADAIVKAKLTISGEGIETIVEETDIPQDAQSVTFEVELTTGVVVTITLELLDSDNVPVYRGTFSTEIEEEIVINIEVQPAAYSAATHIILFRDYLPWESYAMDSMLAKEGYTPGPGENQYEILPSDSFATVQLTPGKDLVIIVNDQDSVFYEKYAANMDKFNNFVYNGGVIFWEACDMGWHYGSILAAGIVFPGGVLIDSTYYYDPYNIIANHEYDLVAGLPDTLTGNYASHETFENLPDDALIFTVNSEGLPTLVLYRYGAGWVMLTGQPLEFNYDRLPDYTVGYLLPRVVNFILGKATTETTKFHTPRVIDSSNSSHR